MLDHVGRHSYFHQYNCLAFIHECKKGLPGRGPDRGPVCTPNSCSTQFPFLCMSFFFNIPSDILLVASTYPLACGWPEEEYSNSSSGLRQAIAKLSSDEPLLGPWSVGLSMASVVEPSSQVQKPTYLFGGILPILLKRHSWCSKLVSRTPSCLSPMLRRQPGEIQIDTRSKLLLARLG